MLKQTSQQGLSLMNVSEFGMSPSLAGIPAEGLPWHFDDSGYYSYLLITADEPLRNAVLEALRTAGYGTTTGPSHRPANNRIQYSHYIRVTRGGVPGKVRFEEIRDFLISLLGPASKTVTPLSRPFPKIFVRPSEQVPPKLTIATTKQDPPKITIAPRIQAPEVGRLSSAGEEELKSLRQALSETTKDRDLYKALFEESSQDSTLKDLRKELGELRATVYELTSQIDGLTTQNKELSLDLEVAHKNLSAIQEWQDAQANDAASQEAEEVSPRDVKPENLDDLFQIALRVLLPKIELHPNVRPQLEHEIDRPDLVLSLLANINNDQVRWKDEMKGAPGWRERYFTKHRNDDGRLYAFRRSNGSWLIYLSDKQNQKADIKRLAALA